MAKKATGKSGTKSSSTSQKKSSARTAVARRPANDAASGSQEGMGDAFIKLLQSPLVAELVAVAATAAFAALAEHGFTSGAERKSRQARRESGEGSRKGRRRRGRPPARDRDRRNSESG